MGFAVCHVSVCVYGSVLRIKSFLPFYTRFWFLNRVTAIFCYYRNGAVGPLGEWKLKDCIAVHKLLGTVLVDEDAALSKYHCDFLLLDYILGMYVIVISKSNVYLVSFINSLLFALRSFILFLEGKDNNEIKSLIF